MIVNKCENLVCCIYHNAQVKNNNIKKIVNNKLYLVIQTFAQTVDIERVMISFAEKIFRRRNIS
jgi:hypothetical protein